jgi:hypothetical protein
MIRRAPAHTMHLGQWSVCCTCWRVADHYLWGTLAQPDRPAKPMPVVHDRLGRQ